MHIRSMLTVLAATTLFVAATGATQDAAKRSKGTSKAAATRTETVDKNENRGAAPQDLGNFEIQRLNRTPHTPRPEARPFQGGAGDGQSIRRAGPQKAGSARARPSDTTATKRTPAKPRRKS